MRKRWKTAAITAVVLAAGMTFPVSAASSSADNAADFFETRDYELSIDDVRWDGDTGYAEWTETEDAHRYEVKVYRGNTLLTSRPLYTTSINYDVGEYITQKGTYTFQVRAVYSNSHRGEWSESPEWEVDEEMAKKFRDFTGSIRSADGSAMAGQWMEDGGRWWYLNRDGSYMRDNWQCIDSKWYYFDSEGYMVTGWVNWKEHSYYCGKDGAMWASCWTPDGYYVDDDGAWVQGYHKQI